MWENQSWVYLNTSSSVSEYFILKIWTKTEEKWSITVLTFYATISASCAWLIKITFTKIPFSQPTHQTIING